MTRLTELQQNEHINRSWEGTVRGTPCRGRRMMRKTFHCYAYGHPGDVEAICVDLDIAVRGSSFSEVRLILNNAIVSYVEDALNESPEVAKALLSRRSPWHVRAKLALRTQWFKFRAHFDGPNKNDATDFEIPCPA